MPGSELRQAIRFPQATALVAGTIIGASIFVQPSEISTSVPSVAGVLAVWLAAGGLTLIGALAAAELASLFPKTGGVYVYLREAFGPPVGFLWGWAMFWSMHSGIVAAIAVIFARYAGYVAPLDDAGTRAVAIGLILLLSAVNYLGVRQGSALQAMFTWGKLLAVALIVALGFVLGGRVETHFVGPATSQPVTADGFLSGLVAGLFAYGGWHMVTYSAEETVDARRTIPRALLLGTLVVTVAYVAMNAVYLYVLPLDVVATSTRVAADFADRLLGSGGGGTMAGIVMFSTFGALTGIILAGPRVYLAMANDGLLFRWFGAVHPRFRTPHRAIVLQAIWASVLVATGTFRALFTRVIYTEWIFFGLMVIGLFLFRRRGARPAFSIWGYPILPALFVVSSLTVVIHQVASNPGATLTGLAMVLAGLPVYWVWTRAARSTRTPTQRPPDLQ